MTTKRRYSKQLSQKERESIKVYLEYVRESLSELKEQESEEVESVG